MIFYMRECDIYPKLVIFLIPFSLFAFSSLSLIMRKKNMFSLIKVVF